MAQQLTLENFLSMFESDLGKTVANIDWMIPERTDIHDSIRRAWEELRPQFEVAKKETHKIAYADASSLKVRGLSGAQLELKIREYAWRRERLLNFDKSKLSKITGVVLKRLLRTLLASADNVLDTLASMVPPVQPIKEFKDTLVSIASD